MWVGARCSRGQPRGILSKDASIDEHRTQCCNHKRALTYFLPRLTAELPYQTAFQACAENEAHAIVSRHACQTPAKRDVSYMSALGQWLKCHKGVVLPYTKDQVLARRSGRLRKRYELGFSLLERDGLRGADASVQAFVKFEKGDYNAAPKPPRLIQHRSVKYCAALSKWLMPVEKLVFSLDAKGFVAGVAQRVFAKGMNSWQRAERISSMERWPDTTWFLVDHSRFDSQLTVPILKGEHAVYRLLCGHNSELDWLLNKQLDNRGWTHNGVKYTVKGTKMSGEYNTALGDSLVNYALLREWTREVDAEIFVDGDDSVVAVSTSHADKLDEGWFAARGWVTKVELAAGRGSDGREHQYPAV